MREGVFVWQNTQLAPLEQLGCPTPPEGIGAPITPDVFKPLAPVQKRAPENRSLFFPRRLTKDSYLLRAAL
jgi:hypothetical protein